MKDLFSVFIHFFYFVATFAPLRSSRPGIINMAAKSTGKEDYELQHVSPSSKAFEANELDETVHRDADGFSTGNDVDAMDMLRMGRAQELRRNFNALSVLGLATTTMSTWVAMMMTSLFSLINGGMAGTIWIYFATWMLTLTLAASLAEMASMAPTSGGQYRKNSNI